MTLQELTTTDDTKAVKIICSMCDGTGMRPFECGPAGAAWTDYERCSRCKGLGHTLRRF